MQLTTLLLSLATASAFVAPRSSLPRIVRNGVSLQASAVVDDSKLQQYKSCEAELKALIDKTNSHPIMVRLAWHDSGTYDKDIPTSEWPKCGGANGSIRFSPEIEHGANAGLTTAVKILEPVKKKFPEVGWADLMQMASAVAIEVAGGPKIDMVYGRKDATGPEDCAPEGNLPGAAAPFDDGSATPQDHLRKVFYRMGFDDQGIVALSGAHTLGRAFKDRSGMGAESTKYTASKDVVARGDGKPGIGRTGGSSWTVKWLQFSNEYFTTLKDERADPELLKLETDKSVFGDEKMAVFAEKYAADQDAFFADYAVAHKKLAELGSVFEPEGGFTL